MGRIQNSVVYSGGKDRRSMSKLFSANQTVLKEFFEVLYGIYAIWKYNP